MMKWIGGLSTLFLVQILFLGILLFAIGRLPDRELGLAWQRIISGKSDLDKSAAKSAVEEKKPASYDDVLRARADESREIERKKRELESLSLAAKARVEAAADSEKAFRKLKVEIQKDFKDKQESYVKEGKDRLLELLTTSSPKVAQGYLLKEQDEMVVVEVLKQLDPTVAAKIFKEFKKAADKEKLNGWLSKLGQGEPEATKLRELRRQMPGENSGSPTSAAPASP